MSDIIQQIEKAVKDALDKGWSINAIAREAGVSRPSLQEWIKGKQNRVSLETAAGLARWLGMRLTKPRIPSPRQEKQSEG